MHHNVQHVSFIFVKVTVVWFYSMKTFVGWSDPAGVRDTFIIIKEAQYASGEYRAVSSWRQPEQSCRKLR